MVVPQHARSTLQPRRGLLRAARPLPARHAGLHGKRSSRWPSPPLRPEELPRQPPASAARAGARGRRHPAHKGQPPPDAGCVALDVEYAHLRLPPGGGPGPRELSLPAWLAVVDERGVPLLKTHVRPDAPAVARWFGGVPPSLWQPAPPLGDVVRLRLAPLLAGRLVVGHGLAKDLAALGLRHPPALLLDTMAHAAFANRAGNARSLRRLARDHLGLSIQQPTAPHDPEEDAVAVMRLYQQLVVPSTYEGQVALATQRLLEEIAARRSEEQEEEDTVGEGSGQEEGGPA